MGLKSLLAGTALLAVTGNALASKTYQSEAKCSISSISKSSSQSKKVAAVAIKEVNAALCYDGPRPYDAAVGAAHASAKVFAEAMVDVSVECVAKGNAEYKINGKSYASAQATGIASAFALAQANAKTCGKCSAAGKAIVRSFEKIYLKATAELEPYFYGKATDVDSVVEDKYDLYTRAYEEATVEAFALAIVNARAEDEKCSGTAFALVGAGEKGDLNLAGCAINLEASTDEYVVDALAAAYASAGASACLGRVASNYYDVEAKAVAEAMAIAVTEVTGSCFIVGEGAYGCAMGEADITKTAKAVATAFASGYAEASSKCFLKCDVKYSAMTTAIADVLATAYSKIYFDQCASEDSFHKEYTETVVVKAAAPAIAKIIADASAHAFGICKVTVDPSAYVGPTYTTKIVDGPYTKPTHPIKEEPSTPKRHTPKRHTPKRHTPKRHTPKRHTPKRHTPKRRISKRRIPKRRISKRGGKGWKKGGRRGSKGVKKISKRTRSLAGRKFFRGKAASKRTLRKN